VIGPEGGISPKEEEYLNSIGFESISLGQNIMRVETVPMFILSVLNYENM
jgi:16S rRNA (uracil1498-N3)-methyltransferase